MLLTKGSEGKGFANFRFLFLPGPGCRASPKRTACPKKPTGVPFLTGVGTITPNAALFFLEVTIRAVICASYCTARGRQPERPNARRCDKERRRGQTRSAQLTRPDSPELGLVAMDHLNASHPKRNRTKAHSSSSSSQTHGRLQQGFRMVCCSFLESTAIYYPPPTARAESTRKSCGTTPRASLNAKRMRECDSTASASLNGKRVRSCSAMPRASLYANRMRPCDATASASLNGKRAPSCSATPRASLNANRIRPYGATASVSLNGKRVRSCGAIPRASVNVNRVRSCDATPVVL